MTDGLIPKRYAMALYKYAEEKKNTKQVYDEMKTVITSFENNPGLNKVLANPFVGNEDKAKLLLAAAGDADADFKSFVNLILKHNREMFALQMALAYRQIYRNAHNISSVTITSAAQLGDNEKQRIDQLLKKSYPDRQLEIRFNVDPDVIGGFVIDVDNQRLDASLRNELEQLRHTLITSN